MLNQRQVGLAIDDRIQPMIEIRGDAQNHTACLKLSDAHRLPRP